MGNFCRQGKESYYVTCATRQSVVVVCNTASVSKESVEGRVLAAEALEGPSQTSPTRLTIPTVLTNYLTRHRVRVLSPES